MLVQGIQPFPVGLLLDCFCNGEGLHTVRPAAQACLLHRLRSMHTERLRNES